MSDGSRLASAQLSPGYWLEPHIPSGTQPAGNAPLRALLAAPVPVSGLLVLGTAVGDVTYTENVNGQGAAGLICGVGTMGHLAAQRFFQENPNGILDFSAMLEPSAGVKATATITFDSSTPVTVAGYITITVAGRANVFAWGIGVSGTAAAAAAVAELALLDATMPVVWSSASGVLTATFKHKGTSGNDCLFSAVMTGNTGGAITVSGAALAGGTLDPNITNALANAVGREHALKILCLSNTDAASVSATNPKRSSVFMAANNFGFAALLEVAFYAHTGALSALLAGIATVNEVRGEAVYFRGAQSLPCEWAAAEAGQYLLLMSTEGPNVNRANRADLPYQSTLYGPVNPQASALSALEAETAVQGGASPIRCTAGPAYLPYMWAPRTTYTYDNYGAADLRAVWMGVVFSLDAVGRDIRTWFPETYPGILVVDVIPDNTTSPRKCITTKALLVATATRIRSSFVPLGVVDPNKLNAAIADGTFRVALDTVNPSMTRFRLPVGSIAWATTFDFQLFAN